MRRFRSLFLLLSAGCAASEPMKAFDTPALKTADERKLELQQNLRDGRSWQEQERMMSDVKNALGKPSGDDVTGPQANFGR